MERAQIIHIRDCLLSWCTLKNFHVLMMLIIEKKKFKGGVERRRRL